MTSENRRAKSNNFIERLQIRNQRYQKPIETSIVFNEHLKAENRLLRETLREVSRRTANGETEGIGKQVEGVLNSLLDPEQLWEGLKAEMLPSPNGLEVRPDRWRYVIVAIIDGVIAATFYSKVLDHALRVARGWLDTTMQDSEWDPMTDSVLVFRSKGTDKGTLIWLSTGIEERVFDGETGTEVTPGVDHDAF